MRGGGAESEVIILGPPAAIMETLLKEVGGSTRNDILGLDQMRRTLLPPTQPVKRLTPPADGADSSSAQDSSPQAQQPTLLDYGIMKQCTNVL